MLVFVYAPWCGHCQAFKPIWEQFKAKYSFIIDIREINSDEQPKLVKTLEVEGFPTILLLSQKHRYEFQGPRTVAGLEAFLKKNYNPHLTKNLANYRSKE